MIELSFRRRSAVTAIIGLVCVSMMPAGQAVADAAELKVLATASLTGALNEIAPAFERINGNKVSLGYGISAQVRNRVLSGEPVDVVILTRAAMDDLQKQNKLVPGSLVGIGGTPMSVAIRAGAPKPDISSVDALKQTLLSAKSIVYPDPAKGGASGVYFARVLDRLGLAEQLKAKAILVPGPETAAVVAKGEAELGITEASGIVPVSGAQVLGPLPGELAFSVPIAAGIVAGTTLPEAANAFIGFVKGQAAAPILKANGFDPA